MDRRLHLVGSIPFETVEEVFEEYGSPLGEHLTTIPDGEVGHRTHWISRVHYEVLSLHPDIKVVRQPTTENGEERLNPRNAGDSWLFKVNEGAGALAFDLPGWRLGFARDAVNSYFVFKTLKEQEKLAPHLRFQVSLPTPTSALPKRVFEREYEDVAKVKPGFEAAMKAEIANIAARIPHEDLAIQWDCTSELQDFCGLFPELPGEDVVARNMDCLRPLCEAVPDDAELGFHLCYGTLGGWPRWEPDDLGGAVAFANAINAHAGRRVDWIHIPILDRSDDPYFAPLSKLETGGARLYLGAIHNMERFEDRIAAAGRYLSDFGVGCYCGLGRHNPETLPLVREEHAQAAKLLM